MNFQDRVNELIDLWEIAHHWENLAVEVEERSRRDARFRGTAPKEAPGAGPNSVSKDTAGLKD